MSFIKMTINPNRILRSLITYHEYFISFFYLPELHFKHTKKNVNLDSRTIKYLACGDYRNVKFHLNTERKHN